MQEDVAEADEARKTRRQPMRICIFCECLAAFIFLASNGKETSPVECERGEESTVRGEESSQRSR